MSNAFSRIWIILSAALGAFLPTVVLPQTTVPLTPEDDLAGAILAASPGDILELQGGDYGALFLRRAGGNANRPITIRSANTADPARLSELDLREVTYMTFDGLIFDYEYNPEDKSNTRPFQAFATRGLTIRNSVFDGDLADGGLPEEDGYPTGFGFSVRSCADIRIEGNEIRDFYRGIVFSDTVDLRVVKNDIHSIRMDGMNFAQVERVLIEANTIRDFKRAVNSADHADMIQFWTNKTERPSRDITIRNNVLNSGLGWYTQSIFMRNEEVDTGRSGPEMYYRNVLIEGNAIINAHLHGITVGETDGLVIKKNSVLHNARSDGELQNVSLWTPGVRVAASAKNVLVEANVFHSFTGHGSQSDWVVKENLEVQDRFRDQPNYYDDIFVAARTGDPRDLAVFTPLANGPLAGTGLGSPILDGKGPSLLSQNRIRLRAPVIRATVAPDTPSQFSFDVEESSENLGLNLLGSRIIWDFGDGSTAEGESVSHLFVKPGTFDVKATITLSSGEVLKSSARVRPTRPEVIALDRETGKIISYTADPPSALGLPLGSMPIQIGGDKAQVVIPREAIAPFFGSQSFTLQSRVRSLGGYKSAGVLFQVYKTLRVTVGGRGTIDVEFSTESELATKVSTQPLPILRGEWTDIVLDYSSSDGLLRVLINGKLAGQGEISGQIRPMEHWGLTLGHPWKSELSFQGEIDSLVLRVGRHDSITADQ